MESPTPSPNPDPDPDTEDLDLLPHQKDNLLINSIAAELDKFELPYTSAIDDATAILHTLLTTATTLASTTTTNSHNSAVATISKAIDQHIDKTYKYLEIHQLPTSNRVELKTRQQDLKSSILSSLAHLNTKLTAKNTYDLDLAKDEVLDCFDSQLERHSKDLKSRVKWMQTKFRGKLSEVRNANRAEIKDTIALDKALMNETVAGMRKERELELRQISDHIEAQLRKEQLEKTENLNTLSENKISKLQAIIQHLQIDKNSLALIEQALKKDNSTMRKTIITRDESIVKLLEEIKLLKASNKEIRAELKESKKLLIMATSGNELEQKSIETAATATTGKSGSSSKRGGRKTKTNTTSNNNSNNNSNNSNQGNAKINTIAFEGEGEPKKSNKWGRIKKDKNTRSPNSQLYSLSSSSLEMDRFDDCSLASSATESTYGAPKQQQQQQQQKLERVNKIGDAAAKMSTESLGSISSGSGGGLLTVELDNENVNIIKNEEEEEEEDDVSAIEEPPPTLIDHTAAYEQHHLGQQLESPGKFSGHDLILDDVNLLRVRLDSEPDLLAQVQVPAPPAATTVIAPNAPILQGQMHARPKKHTVADADNAVDSALSTMNYEHQEDHGRHKPSRRPSNGAHHHPNRTAHSHSAYHRQKLAELGLNEFKFKEGEMSGVVVAKTKVFVPSGVIQSDPRIRVAKRETGTTPEIQVLAAFNEMFDRQHEQSEKDSKQLIDGFKKSQLDTKLRRERDREEEGSSPNSAKIGATTADVDALALALMEKENLMAQLVLRLKKNESEANQLKIRNDKLEQLLQRKNFGGNSVVVGRGGRGGAQARPKTSGAEVRPMAMEMMRPRSAGGTGGLNPAHKKQKNNLILTKTNSSLRKGFKRNFLQSRGGISVHIPEINMSASDRSFTAPQPETF